jgi:hypothetical protein
MIGAYNGVSLFSGVIDEARVYSRALTASQIRALYESGAAKFTTSSSNLQQGTSLANGLIGHWTFDGADITRNQILDKSGFGNHGGYFGDATTTVIGKLGQAVSFVNDGNPDGHVSMGDPTTFDGLTSITVSAWAKSATAGSNTAPEIHIFDKSDCEGVTPERGTFELGGFPASNKAVFLVYPAGVGSPHSSGESTTNIDDGNWHMWTGVYDGTNLSIWVDGVQQNSANVGSFTLSSSVGWLVVGGECDSQYFTWNGAVDDARIYNRALSTAEIRQLYNLGQGTIKP